MFLIYIFVNSIISYLKKVVPFDGNNRDIHYYGCAAVCVPSILEICTTGTLSNKMGPICLTGSLATGVTGAPAFHCDLGHACQVIKKKHYILFCVKIILLLKINFRNKC